MEQPTPSAAATGPAPAGRGAGTIERATLAVLAVLSLALFAVYVRRNSGASYYDENGYLQLARAIRANGLFAYESGMRTYLYPFLVAGGQVLAGAFRLPPKAVFSVLQLALLAVTVWALARTFSPRQRSLPFLTVLGLGLLNPYLVQATTLYLTDLAASCCVALAIWLLLRSDLGRFRNATATFALFYASVMIRPACAVFVVVLPLVLAARLLCERALPAVRILLAAVLPLALFLPQLVNNVANYGHWTPLLHERLYRIQSIAASLFLKYVTVIIPGEPAPLYYLSPFEGNRDTLFLDLAHERPLQFVVLYLLHLFALYDWGYPDALVRDLYAPSRFVASVLQYAGWLLAAYGLAVALRRPGRRFLALGALAFTLPYLAFLGTTCVESRFAYPVYLALLPFAGPAAESLRDRVLARGRLDGWRAAGPLTAFALTAVLSLAGSLWMDGRTGGRIDWRRHLSGSPPSAAAPAAVAAAEASPTASAPEQRKRSRGKGRGRRARSTASPSPAHASPVPGAPDPSHASR